MSLREQILQTELKIKKIEIKDFGFDVYIRELTALESINLDIKHEADKKAEEPLKDANFLCGYIIAGLVDETGKNIFTEDDQASLMELKWGTLNDIVGEIQKLNSSEQSDTDKAKE